MRILLIAICIIVLSGCATSKLQDASSVTSTTLLNPGITQPVGMEIAYHASFEDLNAWYSWGNIYQYPGESFTEALELVMPSMFKKAEFLDFGNPFSLVFVLDSEVDFDPALGTYSVDLDMVVRDRSGKQIYKGNSKKSISTGGPADRHAFTHAYAGAIKEGVTKFLNAQGQANLIALGNQSKQAGEELEMSMYIEDLKPASSGSGAFIDKEGRLLTAAHVVNDCIDLKVNQEGELYSADLLHSSKVIDVALLKADVLPKNTVKFRPSVRSDPVLGEQIFATGYPLADLLSPYPNLTVGNVSSLGALKGAKGIFQFTAPIQPGNSGGPIVSYSGEMIGMVTSSLNQRLMLSKGSVAQNVNFGVGNGLIEKFLNKHYIAYEQRNKKVAFEKTSQEATQYTIQVLCYK